MDVCRDYFYYCMTTNPRLAQVMASQPSTESALVSGLGACLDDFTANVAALARQCRAAALVVADNLIHGLDQKTPELADKVMPAMESFVEKQWQEREKGLKVEIQQLKLEILRSQEEDSMETSPQMNHRAKKAQTDDSDASIRSSIDDRSDITVVECMYMSKISYGLRPPLTQASLSSCVAVDTCYRLFIPVDIDDVVLNNMPAEYFIQLMSYVRDSRYVMTVYDYDAGVYATYAANIDTRDIDKIGVYGNAVNIVTRGGIVVVFKDGDNAVVLDKRVDAGQIDIKCKCWHASGDEISDRYCQQLNGDIYVVDRDANLWRVSWHDIKTGRYDVKCLIDDDVEDFYMHEHGNAILKTTGIIALRGGHSIDMQDVDGDAKWSAVIRSANRWIACGDKSDENEEDNNEEDRKSTIVSFDDRGLVISSMSIRTTPVDGYSFIKYLKTVGVTGNQAIIVAMEHSACCHLISMTASGQLHLVDSMPSIRRPDDWCKQIYSMTETDVEGKYIVAGYSWIKKLTVRLN